MQFTRPNFWYLHIVQFNLCQLATFSNAHCVSVPVYIKKPIFLGSLNVYKYGLWIAETFPSPTDSET
jgi:hypothetical protein